MPCVALLLTAPLMLSDAAAGDALDLRVTAEGWSLDRKIEVLRDPAGQLSFEQVRANAFTLAGERGTNLGFTRDTYWYRIALVGSRQAEDLVLEAAFPPLDFLDLYLVRGDTIGHLAGGDQRPPGATGLPHRNHAFAFRIAAGEHLELYLRAQIDGAHQVPLRLWASAAFAEKTARENLLYGIFYGVMLAMVVYNLLIFVGVRDRAYLYYLLFVAMIALLLVNLDGFAFPVLWAISPKLINGSVPVSIALATVFVPLFIRESLQTREHTPRLHRALTAALWVSAASVFLPLVLPVMEATFINALLGALTTLVMATVVIVQALTGRRTARFYLVTWAALLVGILVKVLEVNGVLPVSTFTVYSIHVGASLLVTLVSLGLADQIVTERRERARLLREKAEARAAAQSEFLAKMSHELRTPMNAIVGFTDLALRDRSDEKRLEHLRLIDGASHSMLRIINNVLDLTRIESGKLSLEAADFNLPAQLDKVMSLLRPSARQGVALKVNLAPEVPAMLVGDPLRLEQVLVNLLGNALKFTERGEVELNVSAQPGAAGRARLEFCVRDTGVGIPADRLPQLFKPFTQADQSITRKYGGSGLGLAICRQLVELMGGTLAAHSEPGRGSEFRFALSLPVSDKPVTARPAAAVKEQLGETAAAQQVRGRRVLLVEDNAMNRRLAGAILTEAGVACDFAENGKDGVAMVRQAAYDAVLMDLQMPEMDGLQATRVIRRLPGYETLPIIAMTANAMDQDREACRQAGMNDFVPKPIDAELLLHTLLKWTPREARATGEMA